MYCIRAKNHLAKYECYGGNFYRNRGNGWSYSNNLERKCVPVCSAASALISSNLEYNLCINMYHVLCVYCLLVVQRCIKIGSLYKVREDASPLLKILSKGSHFSQGFDLPRILCCSDHPKCCQARSCFVVALSSMGLSINFGTPCWYNGTMERMSALRECQWQKSNYDFMSHRRSRIKQMIGGFHLLRFDRSPAKPSLVRRR